MIYLNSKGISFSINVEFFVNEARSSLQIQK